MADEADEHQINFTSSRYRQFCSINPASAESLVHSISRQDLSRLDHASAAAAADNHIPASSSSNEDLAIPSTAMKCCCGRPDCAYLEHNNAALGGLERDIETAARLGQALLDRHEAYVKDSQAEQARLSNYIGDLEDEKTTLQDANHRMVVENRELLQKLELLNTDFGESGKRVKELEDLLQDCEQEIRRLHGLTRKTQELELKVLDMEKECADLTRHVEDGNHETRSTIARWRESERKVRELEHEVQKIEWSAKLDRQKHEDLVARMEKESALERELGLSEGRLKATAAVQKLNHGGSKQQVVSNFVRDILQDNANLQAGIVELRELLQSSNDEVQNLRDQVMLHQPVLDDDTLTPQRTCSLSDELGLSQSLPPKQVQQEVHVHHHYHTKLNTKKEKTPARKAHRRRAMIPSAFSSSPSSGTSTPTGPPRRNSSNPTLPLSIQPVHSKTNRWSMQSNATSSTYMSSMASSPRSHYDRNSSIFDRIERDEESSRPTSPDSFTLSSPLPFKWRDKPGDTALSIFEEEPPDLDGQVSPLDPVSSQETEGEIDVMEDLTKSDLGDLPGPSEMELTPRPSTGLKIDAISELPDATEVDMSPPSNDVENKSKYDDDNHVSSQLTLPTSGQSLVNPSTTIKNQTRDINFAPSIRRSNSHDSLLSISGMDIHLPQESSRSTLTLLRGHGINKHHFATGPTALRRAPASTSQPLAFVTEYTAISRPGLEPSMSASMLALSGIHSHAHRQEQLQTPPRSLMGSVGGWVSSKWGRAPTKMKSVTDLRSPAAALQAAATGSPAQPSTSTTIHPPSPAVTVIKSSGSSITPSTTSESTISSINGKRSTSTGAISVPSSLATPTKSSATSVADFQMSASFRMPGINQMGAIPGFAAAVAAKRIPTLVMPERVDLGGLEESLQEQ